MNSYNGFSPDVRNRAGQWIRDEIAAGRLARRPARCEACGQSEGILDYHAEDYSEPFGPHVYAHPLCYRCHIVLHCRFRSPVVWSDYTGQVLRGFRARALFTRDFGAIKTQLSGCFPLGEYHQPQPTPNVFTFVLERDRLGTDLYDAIRAHFPSAREVYRR